MVSRSISHAAESAMRQWVMKVEAENRLEELHRRKANLPQTGPYIVISREAGVGSSEIAHKVASILNWEALDHELLDEIAEEYDTPVKLMQHMDERPAHWLSDVLAQGLMHRGWSSQTFVHRAARTIQLAGNHGRCVIVGRGAQYLLPHEGGLFVRLIAPLEFRVTATAQREGISEPEAEVKLIELDRQRVQFVKQYFHRDVADLHQYDLVVNVEKLGRATASVIAATYQSQSPKTERYNDSR